MTPASLRFSTFVTVLAALIGSPITSWAQGAQPNAAVSIRGAGSTFAAPFYRKMIEEYAVAHRDALVGYDAVGSGEGVKRFIAQEIDFAGSDEILTESEAAKLSGNGGDAAGHGGNDRARLQYPWRKQRDQAAKRCVH